MPSQLLLPLLALIVALFSTSGPLGAAPFQCTARAATAPTLRTEGLAELAGELLLTCTGGSAQPIAAAPPIVELKLRFNSAAPITSRILDAGNQITEAFALIGEPTPVKQSLCTTPATPENCPAAANVFPAVLTAQNELAWKLPMAAPGDQGQLTVRLTNIRLNAYLLGVTSPQAIITFSGDGAPSLAGGPAVAVGNPSRGLGTSVQVTPASAACSASTITVQLRELESAAAWRRRTVALPTGTVAPPAAAQSILGFSFNAAAETGFYNPLFPGIYKTAGLADQGTRLYIRFTGVPAGVKLYTPITVPIVVNNAGAAADGTARRVVTDAAGAGAFSATAGDAKGLAEMALQNDGRQAVYEVLNADIAAFNRFDVPVTVTYPAGTPVSLAGIRIETGLAPMKSSAAVPRFNYPSDGPQDIPELSATNNACAASGGNNNTSSSSSTNNNGGGGGASPTVAPPPSSAGLYFVPVKPCRVVDTREDAPGKLGRPVMAAGVPRTFALPATDCKLPSDARAYSLNFTVVPKGPLGYITTWAAGGRQPFASTLNAIDGRVKANAAIVPASASGAAIAVVATEATELVVDVNGYFVDAAAYPRALAFYALPPCRIADTREASGPLGGPVIPAGGSRSFPVLSANCGVPANAQAYSLNATVVPKGPLGYLTLWPTGDEQPVVSTLNSPKGEIVANAAIVPAGTNGAVSAFAQGETHLVLDINGYFAPAGAAFAMRYFTVAPCRLMDTREPNSSRLAGIERRGFAPLEANCGLASNAAAYALNATVVPPAALGYLTLWPTGGPQPFVSTLNVITDPVVANAAIVPAGSAGGVSMYVTDPTHVILDVNGFFAP